MVVAGTTGEGATLTDDEKLRLFELAVSEFGGRAKIVAGTGSNDTAHTRPPHGGRDRDRRATRCCASRRTTTSPTAAGRRPLTRRSRRSPTSRSSSTTSRRAASSTCPNDLLARARRDHRASARSSRPATRTSQPIDGLDLLAGNDDTLAEVLDMGGAGGITVASHLVGSEMRRMIDEPDRRAGDTCQPCAGFKAMAVTTNPIPMKAAMRLLGHDVGGSGCRWWTRLRGRGGHPRRARAPWSAERV